MANNRLSGRGQITITDLHDARTLAFTLLPNHFAQDYNRDKQQHSPNFETNDASRLTLTPNLSDGYSADGLTRLRNAPTYTVNGDTLTNDPNHANNKKYEAVVEQVPPYRLYIKKNIASGLPGYDVRCSGAYVDPFTQLSTEVIAAQFVKLQHVAAATLTTGKFYDNGNTFDQNHPDPKRLRVELRKGGAVDTTARYQWYKLADGNWQAIAGATSATYDVQADDVDSFGNFKCSIQDVENGQTVGDPLEEHFEIFDKTDPIEVVVTVLEGSTTFINGDGYAKAQADIFQGGEFLSETEHAKYDYVWTKLTLTGQIDADWATRRAADSKKRVLVIRGEDVTRQGRFVCDVRKAR